MTAPKTVLVGDRVRWMSRDGWKRGEVLQIFNTQDAYGEYVDYFRIAYNDGFGGTGVAMMCDDQLDELQFRVTFRDCVNYDVLAKRYAYERSVEV